MVIKQKEHKNALKRAPYKAQPVYRQGSRNLVFYRAGQLPYQQNNAVQQPPKQVFGTGAVPKARDTPYDKYIEDLAYKALAASPQGNVEILAEKGGKRNVPLFPQIVVAGSQKWAVEIFGKGEPKHSGRANHDVTAAAEICVQVVGKQRGRQQYHRAEVKLYMGKYAIEEYLDVIGDHHALYQPP